MPDGYSPYHIQSLQQRTGVFELQHYVANCALLWARHVARMPKSRLQKRLMLLWVQELRIAGGQEMTFGRSLERHLQFSGLTSADGTALAFIKWAHLAQDRAGWYKLVNKAPLRTRQAFCTSTTGRH